MDVLYERWKPRTRAFMDSLTAFFLVFYLAFMVRGGIASSAYSLKYNQTNYSAWRRHAPIKIIMTWASRSCCCRRSRSSSRTSRSSPAGDRMSYEAIAVLMFSTFMLLLLTGQRVFAPSASCHRLRAGSVGEGAVEMPFASTITLLNWYPMLTLPMFIYMGYMLSESGSRATCTACSTSGRGPCAAAGGRHDPAHGGDLGDERPERGGHGDRATIALPELLKRATTRSW